MEFVAINKVVTSFKNSNSKLIGSLKEDCINQNSQQSTNNLPRVWKRKKERVIRRKLKAPSLPGSFR